MAVCLFDAGHVKEVTPLAKRHFLVRIFNHASLLPHQVDEAAFDAQLRSYASGMLFSCTCLLVDRLKVLPSELS